MVFLVASSLEEILPKVVIVLEDILLVPESVTPVAVMNDEAAV